MKNTILIAGLSLFSMATFSAECKQVFKDPSYLSVKRICDDNGQIQSAVSTSTKTGKTLSEKYYNNGMEIESFFYRDGERFARRTTEYIGNDYSTFIERNYTFPENVLSDYKRLKKVGEEKILLSQRYYSEKDNNKLTHELIYNEHNQVAEKDLFDSAKSISKKVFYSYQNSEVKKPFKFYLENRAGEQIANHSIDSTFDFDKVYSEDLSYSHKKSVFNQENKTLVAIVDSGVDFNHPDLAYKMFHNENDPIDGIDNDGNGLVDDYIGWAEPFKVGLPYETIEVKGKKRPTSHGTHVSSIFTRDLENVSILPFTGDYGESFFLKIMNKEMKSKGVQFCNMSFGLPHYRTQMIPYKTHIALKGLITNNSSTLFVVASGNDGKELGLSVQNSAFPASFRMENIFTIGALDTDFLVEKNMPNYKMADFSNYSETIVDILAPGSKVNGAALGGGYIRHSGTSMATPYALRESINLKNNYPSLSNSEIKEIMMLSAYIPNLSEPFPVKSGGMIFPRRSLEVARVFIKDRGSIKEASIQVRRNENFLLKGEDSSEEYLDKLKAFWIKRKI